VRYDWRFDLVLGNLGFLARGVGVTVGVCLLAFILAFLIGFFVAFARLSRFRLLRIAGQIYVDLIRSTPILIQLVWIFYALPILTGISFSLLETGVLGLGLYGSA
jgi:polar amino acid transport system permease protein